ncbi:extracellular catalytic domain type 1 short-chain-length polyhydroxyalkanoate depolymerase [Effusibacillus pohliae]|uniref:extracellular catalytic domain type 1 short-chain-length polyhydroxyalkanoate depolymerase n=1 Tax=Effusibacillus pohliae TaxID=232270 RepID=UPI00035FBC82|nr:PHB depolymerase family esterase [Effusibacillus pohliae]
MFRVFRYYVRYYVLFLVLMLVASSTLFGKGYAASGTFDQFTYSGTAGSRPYFVYTPANYSPSSKVPLIVMLHGCTQTPADFAAGTQMNALADQYNFIVVYPQQTSTYNQNQCWNWFNPSHQSRGSGEPAIIAGIVQTVEQNTTRWNIDTNRVYVAGLSAGAAMSVIMGATYPDIFAAIGVHSGLEYKAATDTNSALTAMRQGGPNPSQQGQAAYNAMGSYAREVPTIVFQGTGDYTVYPINGDQVVQQWMATNHLASNNTYNADFSHPSSTTTGQVSGTNGKSYTVYQWNDNNANVIQEYWKVNGMGHAWSGGSYSGSYTDPTGPNASQAMYNFFMAHPMNNVTVSASPKGGTYNNSVSVTLSANPSNATIYYTTDGTDPTTGSTRYTSAITISQTTTLKFFAQDASGHKSSIQTEIYQINNPGPVITASPTGNSFGGPVTVTLSSNESGTTIYYTTDGSTPTTSSSRYSGPLNFTTTTTLKYFGVDSNGYSSQVQTQTYTIQPFSFTVTPPGGSYQGAQSVNISMNVPGTIYYTTDGSTPTPSSTKYTGPITVGTSETLKFIGVDLANNQSAVQSQTYTITTPPTLQTLVLKSIAAEDGYVYQYSSDGQPNSMIGYIEVGSSSLNHGERGILSFDTSQIPKGATIVSATITLYRYDGTYFADDLGPITADISPIGGFNGNYALEQADYGAASGAANIGNFDAVPTAQYQAISDTISQSAMQYINLNGHTQFRIHFQKDTNNDNALDVIRFFSGDSSFLYPQYVPTLTIKYY